MAKKGKSSAVRSGGARRDKGEKTTDNAVSVKIRKKGKIGANKGEQQQQQQRAIEGKLLNSKNASFETETTETLHNGSVFVARNFLSGAECRAWIDFMEGHGRDSSSLPSTSKGMELVSHPASAYIAHRECYRWSDKTWWTMADRIFDRMRPVLFREIFPQL